MLNLKEISNQLKTLREFKVEEYLNKKVLAINNFFYLNNLDAAVIGISGGIDSALSIRLLKEAHIQKDSPLKKILGLVMPIKGNGTTGQDEAMEKAIRFMEVEQIDYLIADLTSPYNEYLSVNKQDTTPWTNGQLASIVRTPYIYFQAAYLQQQGYKSLVVGTTNRDEGSYIGFFGKASDAMVDLQPIADIHKTEVYELAKHLNIYEDIIKSTPRGDVWDGKIDEEMIGAPYWFLEIYLLIKEYNKFDIIEHLSLNEKELYLKYSRAIENIHSKNAHKYKVGNPAHFIDVMNRKIPGGWN